MLYRAKFDKQMCFRIRKNDAVILATKVTDTIKIVDDEGYIKETPNRRKFVGSPNSSRLFSR